MSVNIKKLREKMAEKHISNEDMAKLMNMDASTFYRKLKSEGTNFTVGQMHTIADVLDLSNEDTTSIFLWENSQ